jgi:hypothetical protein
LKLKIHSSARKHGIADADIEHAVRHAMSIDDRQNDTRLYLGPARNANLLEVVTVFGSDGVQIAIHAMAVRSRYLRLLTGE